MHNEVGNHNPIQINNVPHQVQLIEVNILINLKFCVCKINSGLKKQSDFYCNGIFVVSFSSMPE